MAIDDSQPVRVLARRKVGANTRWRVFFDHVIDDRSGAEVPDFLVLQPRDRRPDGLAGVAVVPMVGHQIALVRNYRHAVGCWCWEVVRGFIDADEEPGVAATREVEEELGITCTGVEPLGVCLLEPSTIDGKVALYVAHCGRGRFHRDPSELGLGDATLFSQKCIRRMLREGQIQDVSTMVALHSVLSRPRMKTEG